jgi:hypothetical protein
MDKLNNKDGSATKRAKMDNLHALRKMAMSMINSHAAMTDTGLDDGPDGQHKEVNDDGTMAPTHMERVLVAAKNKEGLQKGLEKAHDMVSSFDDAEEPMKQVEDSMLDHSPEGERSSEDSESDTKSDDALMGHDHLAHHSEPEGDAEQSEQDDEHGDDQDDSADDHEAETEHNKPHHASDSMEPEAKPFIPEKKSPFKKKQKKY